MIFLVDSIPYMIKFCNFIKHKIFNSLIRRGSFGCFDAKDFSFVGNPKLGYPLYSPIMLAKPSRLVAEKTEFGVAPPESWNDRSLSSHNRVGKVALLSLSLSLSPS